MATTNPLSGLNSRAEYAVAPTVEEVVRECDSAWEEARAMINNRRDSDARENDIYVELVRAHGELNKTYPAIIAAMASGSYDRGAVRKFFKYVRQHPWKSEQDFLDTQAVYSTILYRVTHPHASQTAIKAMRTQTRIALEENEKKTKEEMEAIKREAEENNKRRAKGRIADLLARAPCDAPILMQDEVRPVVVSYDDSQ